MQQQLLRSKPYYMILSLVFVVMLINFFLRAFPGFISGILIEQYSLSASDYGLVEFAYFIPYACIFFVFGVLGYRCRLSSLWLGAFVAIALAFVLVAWVPFFSVYLLSCCLIGVSGGFIWVLFFVVLNNTVAAHKRASYVAYLLMCASLGQMLSSITGYLWVTPENWVYFYLAGLVIGALGIAGYYLSGIGAYFRYCRKQVLVTKREPILKKLRFQHYAMLIITSIVFATVIAFVDDWAISFETVSVHETSWLVKLLPLVALLGNVIGAWVVGYWAARLNRVKPLFIAMSFGQLLWLLLVILVHPGDHLVLAALFLLIGLFSAIIPLATRGLQLSLSPELQVRSNLLIVFLGCVFGALVGYAVGLGMGDVPLKNIELHTFQVALTPVLVLLVVAAGLSLCLAKESKDEA